MFRRTLWAARGASVAVRGFHGKASSKRQFAGVLPVFGLGALGIASYAYLSRPTYLTELTKDGTVVPPITLPLPEAQRKHRDDDKKPFTRASIADAAEIALPSVVNITVNTTVGRYYWAREAQASGSGFIVAADGTVLTNAHVVSSPEPHGGPMRDVMVTLADGSVYPGRVLSVDKLSDIAVVRFDPEGRELPVSHIGSSKELRAGEWVIAVGSPLTLQNTVTAGIVSATGRDGAALGISGSRVQYIQSDAAVNFGNSGGPLVNLDGEVVGIATMRTQGEGISFAIPIDTAMGVMRQLLKHGYVKRPYIGISMARIDARMVKHIKRRYSDFPNVDHGVLVTTVQPNSPGARAGVLPGDVIMKVDNAAVDTPRQVIDALGDDIGKALVLTVVRADNHGKEEHKEIRIVSEQIPSQ